MFDDAVFAKDTHVQNWLELSHHHTVTNRIHVKQNVNMKNNGNIIDRYDSKYYAPNDTQIKILSSSIENIYTKNCTHQNRNQKRE